jgi:hypothetical protein
LAKPLVDLSEFDVWLGEWRELFRAGGVGSGRFARVPRGSLDGRACADFAIIDYTVGPWPLPPSELELRVGVLQQFQSNTTGYFDPDARPPTVPLSVALQPNAVRVDVDNDELDTVGATAYFLAALELLGARCIQPLRALEPSRTPAGIERLLESLDWSRPSTESARAAGVASCLATAGDVGPEWFERYLAWLDREVDPKTGFWRAGIACDPMGALLGAYQHYTIYDRFHAVLPRPERALKTALDLQRHDGLYSEQGPGWAEVAAVYVIDRSFRQCGKLFARAQACLAKLAAATDAHVREVAYREKIRPYRMAGLVSLLALISSALPGSVKSGRPLRFYADRRLFV